MKTVIVVTGGTSGERAVSLRSGEAVRAALEAAGYAVTVIDYADGLETHKTVLQQAAVVFPAIHGPGGEDGELQAGLEALGVRFVGSDAAASALCMDKWRFRGRVQGELPLAAGELVTAENFEQSTLAQRPYVLKPRDGGSSLDTFIVKDPATADAAQLMQALERNGAMLLESLVKGVEITVGVLDNTALPVVEIIPPADGEFDYDNKYNGKTQELCPPRHVSAAVQQQAQCLAVRAHQLTGCRDLSRSDFIVTANDEPVLLEINTLPGLTDQSLYPKEAAAAGLSMSQLVDRLVQLALAR